MVIPMKDARRIKKFDSSGSVTATMFSKVVSILIYIKVVPVYLNETGEKRLHFFCGVWVARACGLPVPLEVFWFQMP